VSGSNVDFCSERAGRVLPTLAENQIEANYSAVIPTFVLVPDQRSADLKRRRRAHCRKGNFVEN